MVITKQYKLNLVYYFILIFSVSILLLLISPWILAIPHRDSGIFLFIGSAILKGKTLYLELWDHKQPLIFLINALGLWIGNGKTWGVWLIEGLLFISAFCVTFSYLKSILKPKISLLILLISLLAVIRYMEGNYTEEYSVCFQLFVIFILFVYYLPSLNRRKQIISSFMIGLISGMAFLLKQVYIEALFSIIMFLVIQGWISKEKRFYIDMLIMFSGFLFVNIILILWLKSRFALSDYWNASFIFNSYYSGLNFMERINSIISTIQISISNPIFALTLLIWISITLFILTKIIYFIRQGKYIKQTLWICIFIDIVFWVLFIVAKTKGKNNGWGLIDISLFVFSILFIVICYAINLYSKHRQSNPDIGQNESLKGYFSKLKINEGNSFTLLLLGYFQIPIILVSIALSGRQYSHYFISMLSPSILLLSGLVTILNNNYTNMRIAILFIISLLILNLLSPLQQVLKMKDLPVNSYEGNLLQNTSEFIRENSLPTDKILIWGYDAVLYFLSDRDSITRYFNQFAAYKDTPIRSQVQQTIYFDLISSRPKLIIDSNLDNPPYEDMPLIERQSKDVCLINNPADGNDMQKIINFICGNYEKITTIGNFDIYRLHSK